MNKFFVEIVTPQRQAFAQEADAVSVPSVNGTMGVLAHHVPLFAALSEGEVKISAGGKHYFLAIGGGFIEITRSKVSILVSRAYHADELNEAEIKKAREQAQQAISRRVVGAELAAAQAILRRSALEMKVVRRRRPSLQA